MDQNIKHIQVRTDPQTYKKLRLICVDRGWTLQTLFSTMIQDYIEATPELQGRGKDR